MIFNLSRNNPGVFTLGIDIAYNHDAKSIAITVDLVFGSLEFGYQWGQ